jgi:predicted extracellular nuclease
MFSFSPHVRLLLSLLFAVVSAEAQLNYNGGVLLQDFNTLPAAGAFPIVGKGPQALNQAPIGASGAAGWSLYANVGTPLSFLFDAGGNTTASVYSYGVPGTSERALGLLANSSRVCRAGWRLINNTGQTLTQFTLSYVGEKWRTGGTANPNQLTFGYRIQATAFDLDSGGAFTTVPALTFTAPASTGLANALAGNAAANRTLLSATVTGISWPAGQMLVLRWQDSDSTEEDDALALDDVVFYSAGPASAPLVLSTVPASGATGVMTTSRLAVIFDQPVNVVGPWAQLTAASTGAIPVTIAGGPLRYEITPNVRLQPGESYTFTIAAGQVTNTGGAAMAGNVTTTFVAQPAATNLQAISAVQSAAVSTHFAGQTVTVHGVVTADFQGTTPGMGGFFVQSLPAETDADSLTSEGLFVYDFTSEGSAPVAVGDVVAVTGMAGEFGAQTQLSYVTSLIVEGTAALPARTDAALPMFATTDLEPLEAMRVRFPQTLHVTSASQSASFSVNYARQGELILASDGPLIEPTEIVDPNDDPASGTNATGASNGPAIALQANANFLRTLVLDDASSAVFPDPTPFLNAQGTRRCGDTVTGLSGILSFAGGRHRIQPDGPVTFVDANPRPLTPPNVGGRLKVVAMNVLNYFTTFGGANDRGASGAAEFQRQKDKIVAALHALDADVLGLLEIQNTAAAANDLVSALNAVAVGGTYAVVPDPTVGPGGDFIRTLLLYRPAKVSLFGPCFADDNVVWNTPNPLRYPLAQVFVENSTGERFIGCLNHWKSKSSTGATGADLDQGDGQGAFNDLRRQQAARLHAWLQGVCATVGDNDVLLFGDLNSHGEEDPLDVLRAAGYADQGTRFHSADYSYRLTETRGRLDHAFATATMASQIGATDHWHINADEPAFHDYNLENKSAAQQAINVGTPFRSSDHDPVLIGVSLAPQPTTYAMWSAARLWPGGAGSLAEDDPDRDGLKNLAEFILNTDPMVANAPQAVTASRDSGAFQLLFRQRTNAVGVAVFPEWSENLVDWAPLAPGSPTAIDALTNLQPATTPIAGRTKMFGRLRIELAL